MAGPLTRSGSGVELVVAGKGFKAESAPVDQMELPNGVVVDQGLLVFPRSDWNNNDRGVCVRTFPGGSLAWRRTRALTAVGAVGELELVGQECRESLLFTSQMEEDTEVISDQRS